MFAERVSFSFIACLKQKLIHLGIKIAVITNYIYEADLLKALYLQIKIK